ncbi:S9 family peptidase [Shewanella avicenniae]|uniref:S9 family peptidase n=1 Tax=Shewanella avicenniae TaxID=2814294 RepID=A0ABX7QVT4_9GAMM|nr:S9 family peptidase [Shewanella avicenniae]QSX35374.1 S9 family peptidase [Shewanella avicenniae]
MRPFGLIALSLWLCGCANTMKAEQPVVPPVANKIPHQLTIHGVTRTDDYYWLRDDSRSDPKVLEYLKQENNYTAEKLKPFNGLKAKLFDEMTARLNPAESSAPYKWHSHWYSRRYEAGKEYPLLERADSLNGPAQLLLDSNERAQGHEFYTLGDVTLSPNEQLMAFAEDTLSRRIYTVQIKDLNSGKLLDDVLQNVDGAGLAWSKDNRYLFYIAKDPQTLLGYQVFRHKLGTPQTQDQLVYEEKDDTYYISLGSSLDESRIVLSCESTTTSEVLVLDSSAPLGNFQVVTPREEGIEYQIVKHGNDYYILTNWQADNFRLMKVNTAYASDKRKWQEVIPHNPDVLLEEVLVLDNFLILQTRENGLTHVVVYPAANPNNGYELRFDDPAYVVGLGVNLNQHARELRVRYSSPTTPDSTYLYDLDQPGKRTLIKQRQVLGGFDRRNYQSERLRITARDGTLVPVTLVYRKDKFRHDGTNPLYVYGYGSYGIVIDPDFDDAVISLLDRGVVYAIAHVRGSETLGRAWYEDGKLLHKQNTFNDFEDVTRGLVAEKYAAAGKVVAAGGSAGGLLMGAVANQAPELYLAIAAHVPFVDVVTTMLDESIPLTTNEYDEWGNPNQQSYFDYMLSYSPYDNVKRQAYPNLLVTSGLHDSQVQYFEPAKWVAKLRDYKTDDNLLLLNMDMEAGHGGKSGRYRRYEDTALEYAFFLKLLGIND